MSADPQRAGEPRFAGGDEPVGEFRWTDDPHDAPPTPPTGHHQGRHVPVRADGTAVAVS
ncbi:hypothetical protein [Saccharothrix carnea]|uniref:hypothetical protein n=1 Tax=Saccharothrix carnea TaxID=1280637 RepID=UPI0015E79810|nr:hypothetical protein [Saccharothrix carnea]